MDLSVIGRMYSRSDGRVGKMKENFPEQPGRQNGWKL